MLRNTVSTIHLLLKQRYTGFVTSTKLKLGQLARQGVLKEVSVTAEANSESRIKLTSDARENSKETFAVVVEENERKTGNAMEAISNPVIVKVSMKGTVVSTRLSAVAINTKCLPRSWPHRKEVVRNMPMGCLDWIRN